jgi:hypothetical protein
MIWKQCEATTSAGLRCLNSARAQSCLCGSHNRIHNGEKGTNGGRPFAPRTKHCPCCGHLWEKSRFGRGPICPDCREEEREINRAIRLYRPGKLCPLCCDLPHRVQPLPGHTACQVCGLEYEPDEMPPVAYFLQPRTDRVTMPAPYNLPRLKGA